MVTGGVAARLLAHAKSRWRVIRWILALRARMTE
jgi:hypothetical protein